MDLIINNLTPIRYVLLTLLAITFIRYGLIIHKYSKQVGFKGFMRLKTTKSITVEVFLLLWFVFLLLNIWVSDANVNLKPAHTGISLLTVIITIYVVAHVGLIVFSYRPSATNWSDTKDNLKRLLRITKASRYVNAFVALRYAINTVRGTEAPKNLTKTQTRLVQLISGNLPAKEELDKITDIEDLNTLNDFLLELDSNKQLATLLIKSNDLKIIFYQVCNILLQLNGREPVSNNYSLEEMLAIVFDNQATQAELKQIAKETEAIKKVLPEKVLNTIDELAKLDPQLSLVMETQAQSDAFNAKLKEHNPEITDADLEKLDKSGLKVFRYGPSATLLPNITSLGLEDLDLKYLCLKSTPEKLDIMVTTEFKKDFASTSKGVRKFKHYFKYLKEKYIKRQVMDNLHIGILAKTGFSLISAKSDTIKVSLDEMSDTNDKDVQDVLDLIKAKGTGLVTTETYYKSLDSSLNAINEYETEDEIVSHLLAASNKNESDANIAKHEVKSTVE